MPPLSEVFALHARIDAAIDARDIEAIGRLVEERGRALEAVRASGTRIPEDQLERFAREHASLAVRLQAVRRDLQGALESVGDRRRARRAYGRHHRPG